MTAAQTMELADRLESYRSRYSGDWSSAIPTISWSDLDLIVAALRSHAVGGGSSRETLTDANWKDAAEFCKGAFGPFVLDVSDYTKIVAELMQHATDRALALSRPDRGGGNG